MNDDGFHRDSLNENFRWEVGHKNSREPLVELLEGHKLNDLLAALDNHCQMTTLNQVMNESDRTTRSDRLAVRMNLGELALELADRTSLEH